MFLFCCWLLLRLSFFFREEKLSFVLVGLSFIYYLFRFRLYITKEIFFILFILSFWYFLQYVYVDSYQITSVLSRCFYLYGAFFIALILERRFIRVFVNVIVGISIISLVIYFLSYIPSVKSYLIGVIAPNFIPLNVENAIQKGGGINILIYNFQINYIDQTVGYMRNCGPFWEPGMFAVFLNIALFFHNFIGKPNVFYNVILVVALITTFSTGGYSVALFVFLLYILQFKQNVIFVILEILVFIWMFIKLQEMEYVGAKIEQQIIVARQGMGSDISRFGAMLTQIEMIKTSPFFGGEDMVKYITSSTYNTLASGFLKPFVVLGIPMGFLYYCVLFRNFVLLSKSYLKSSIIGLFLFLLILGLSVSQTILFSCWMQVFLFVGLIRIRRLKYKKNEKV